MKILISDDSGGTAHFFIRLGMARALVASGHEVVLWDVRSKSAFDAFDEFKPDIFMGQTYNVDDGLVKVLTNRTIPFSLRGSDWGPLQQEIDLEKYPILVAKDKEIALCSKLLPLNPIIDCHYPEEYLDRTIGFWKNFGFKTISLLTAADIFDYTKGSRIPEFETDVCFIGGRWGYKSRTLDKYIVPLGRVNKRKNAPLNMKVFGNQPWNIPQYCGFLGDRFVKDALASATVCPNVHEPHSQDFGYDIVERVWKLGSNKCFCVSDSVEGLKKIFSNDEIVIAETPEEFRDAVIYYINNPEERLPYIDRYYNTIMNRHTYFHRASQWLAELGFLKEAEHVMFTYQNIKTQLGL
jgi:hypothetical protein